VGKSAGVFDPEKLAWANRHYMKAAAPERLATLSLPFLQQSGWVTTPPQGTAFDFLASAVVAAAASVDHLDQVPARLRFVFDYSASRALEDPAIRAEAEAAGTVVDALAAVLSKSPRLLTRELFRAAAAQVRERTGVKGKDLFHPIRLALTGEAEGMELDTAVPVIDRGAGLEGSSLAPIVGARERAAEFARLLRAR
jgi:glutamyl-tRNA synthetase/nondiscriminating glutamyl-tRNA synthetase